MENKYGKTAYIIMVILVCITAIALITAHSNYNYNKEILDQNNENIMDLVNECVSLCSEAYDRANAPEEDKISLDEYITNIQTYDNIRTKANIAMAMVAHVSDYLVIEEDKGNISYSLNETMQRKLAPTLLSLQAALEIN